MIAMFRQTGSARAGYSVEVDTVKQDFGDRSCGLRLIWTVCRFGMLVRSLWASHRCALCC